MSRAGSMLVLAAALGATSLAPAVRADAPYAGWQDRPVSGLSAEQVEDLRNGRGMGLALPAELNGHPGPRHVLDLAGRLGLTPDQRDRVEALFEEMRAGAIEIGERILAGEQALDRLFESRGASPPAMREATLAIGRLQGELRAHHLGYHLAMREMLDPAQLRTYQRLRGYLQPDTAGGHRHGRDRHRPSP